jgi:drug/metabolite transporter (DMT)-like permease
VGDAGFELFGVGVILGVILLLCGSNTPALLELIPRLYRLGIVVLALLFVLLLLLLLSSLFIETGVCPIGLTEETPRGLLLLLLLLLFSSLLG